MRRLVLLATVVAGLTVAATAQAKGPVAATIDGPGTGGGISIGGNGEPGSGATLGTIAAQSGLYPAVFTQTPDAMLETRPKGDLGPRYTLTYNLAVPNGPENRIRQDLYPYAPRGPVTFTAPGQRLFGTRSTHGGWYQAAPALKDTLVKAGLPRTAPSGSSGDGGTGFTDFWPAFVTAFVLGFVALTAVVVRRRPRTAAT